MTKMSVMVMKKATRMTKTMIIQMLVQKITHNDGYASRW